LTVVSAGRGEKPPGVTAPDDRAAKDSMSTNTRVGVNASDDTTADRVEGPIMELDRYGEPTGYSYFACKLCGREAMYQRDLSDCCTEGDGR